ncbi:MULTISPECIES: LssY C-terminal domain-containing protein [unclassified Enterococcus]|uniref:LssY C-terminal domain-containing protein n=1 Tax=unclassified Enterococcus TaxID=2608891 RepID=UPI001CE09E29|nr:MULTISPECIES: LssY C-terminal domain-containing protein [unclassified Enterococcus]MCA5012195.1 LssY C-terminal domain-containing protein [Enterococcus sp. S23]MCA5015446.1 LssY C-terminal domain-containing protein [Enterococcus sp. S22(2020)]
MKKQTLFNSVFRLIRFIFIVISGSLIYQVLFSEILTKKIHIFAYILLWLFSSYLILPFINKLMTGRYLPDYFIGRSQTSDGLLGDPINLAFIGSKAELEQLFMNSGWTIAEKLSLRSSIKMIIASVLAKSYPSAPVSSLFLFGKRQDIAFEKQIENNPRRRHHVRFWQTPENWYLPGGRQADWLGAATYDKKVGFSFFTGQVTHKINSDVDKERDFVLETFEESKQPVSIELVEHFTTSYHGRNGGGDEIFTDGALPFIKMK